MFFIQVLSKIHIICLQKELKHGSIDNLINCVILCQLAIIFNGLRFSSQSKDDEYRIDELSIYAFHATSDQIKLE